MNDLYPESGRIIKRVVRIVNVVGYAISDLIGLYVGVVLGMEVYLRYGRIALALHAGFIAAGAVAAVLVFLVWFLGLLLWTYSNIADDVRHIREHTHTEL